MAAQQVDLIGTCGGDDHMGLLRPGFQQHVPGHTVALEAHHVQLVGQAVQDGVGLVHDGDAVALVRQVLGQGGAHLSGACDDNGQDRIISFP